MGATLGDRQRTLPVPSRSTSVRLTRRGQRVVITAAALVGVVLGTGLGQLTIPG